MKKSRIIALVLLLSVVVGVSAFNYVMHGGGRNLLKEETNFWVSSNDLAKEFSANTNSAKAKYIEKAEDIRHVRGNKAIYQKRKETIERIFGTAKEHHGFRYTQYIGKARMEMKAGLTFACMNLKKLARFLGKNGLLNGQKRRILRNFWIQFNFKGKNGAGMIPAPSLSTV